MHQSCSHLHTQQVAQADLSDVVADELVVLQVSVGDVGVAWLLARVGLFSRQLDPRISKGRTHTIFTPASEGCSAPASLRPFGAVMP